MSSAAYADYPASFNLPAGTHTGSIRADEGTGANQLLFVDKVTVAVTAPNTGKDSVPDFTDNCVDY